METIQDFMSTIFDSLKAFTGGYLLEALGIAILMIIFVPFVYDILWKFIVSKVIAKTAKIAHFMVKYLPGSKLVQRLDDNDKLTRFIAKTKINFSEYLDNKFAKNTNPMVRGDLKSVREQTYSKQAHPELYEPIRSDMNPGEIVSSRIVGGRPLTDLVDRYVTDSVVNEVYNRHRFPSILIYMQFVLVFGVIASLYAISFNISYWQDQWTTAPEALVFGYGMMISASVVTAMISIWLNPFLYISAFLLSYLYVATIIPKNIHQLMLRYGNNYTSSIKDFSVGYKYCMAAKEEDRVNFLNAIKHNRDYLAKKGMDKSVSIGKATGEFRSRGLSEYIAPLRGQEIRLDREALTCGVAVIGQTGSGKTSSLLLPMYRSLVSWKEAGFFIMDSKAVLWKDCQNITEKYMPERLKDFVVIGTEDADYGVDLLEGLSPNQVSDGIRSVFDQIAGDSSGDDYWPSAATYVVMHAARLAQAYEYTEAGMQHFERTGERPYSLYFIYNLIRSNAMCDMIAKAVLEEFVHEKPGRRLIEASDIVGVLESVDYLTSESSDNPEAFRKMSDGQKSGVIGSVTKIMGQLSAIKVLREKFARGRRDHVIDVNEAMNSRIVAVNISKEETGIAGQLIMTFLKNRLYQSATIRQTHMKLNNLGNPQDKPVFLIADEMQNFISSSKTIGISDGNAFNTLRSTGLTGILAFQNFSSIIRVLGDKVANDFLAQMITKIVLVNQDDETRKFCVTTTGKSLRMRTHRDAEHENFWQVVAERGYPKTPEEVDKYLKDNGSEGLIQDDFTPAIGRDVLPVLQQQSSYRVPPQLESIVRNMPSGANLLGMGGDTSAQIAILNARADLVKRQEDTEAQYITSGNEITNVIDEAEISRLPRWKAWVSYPQAGLMKMDFIELSEGIF